MASLCRRAWLVAALWPWPALAAAAPGAVISFATTPAQLIRGTTLFGASPGTILQEGDIVQAGASGLQIEGLAGATVALGPHAQMYLIRTGTATTTELSLLNGWLKVQRGAPGAASGLAVDAGALQLAIEHGAAVLHVEPDQVDLFAVDGSQTVAALDQRGRLGRKVALMHGQAAAQRAGQAIDLTTRPSKPFIGAMPASFFDGLVPVAGKLHQQVAVVNLRPVEYADLAPWLLTVRLPSQAALATRFAPRLADPGFRRQLEADLGAHPDASTNAAWRAPVRGRQRYIPNVLF